MAANPQQTQSEDILIEELREIVGDENVLSEPDELLVYECDGLPQHKHPPRAVVFPESTEQISTGWKLRAHDQNTFSPRGTGTRVTRVALAVHRNVVIELARLRSILINDINNSIVISRTSL